MALVPSGNLFGGFRPDLQKQEDSAKDFVGNLLKKENISAEELTEGKNKLHALERKSALYNAVVDTIHRIIMDIIRSMGR
jgi:hypothetical protein